MKAYYKLCIPVLAALAGMSFWCGAAQAQGNEYRYHKYWDGKKAPAVAPGSCDEQKRELFKIYGRPELMAMGDSLYNGVQSLRINSWLSEWSAPSLVAMSMGLIEEENADRTGKRSFYGPQYPDQGLSAQQTRSYGFNLEDISYRTSKQRERLRELAFDYVPENGRVMVDNIAFLSANSIDLIDVKPSEYRKAAKTTLDLFYKSIGGVPSRLANAVFYANAYFVLNPTKNKCVDEMSALEQVAFRKPKRLLINIGSNNGLYRISAFGKKLDTKRSEISGSFDDDNKELSKRREPDLTVREFIKGQFINDMEKIIKKLSTVEGLEEVYINNLALPSQPANMVPTSDGYMNDLFSSPNIPLKEMKGNDDVIRKVNGKLKDMIDGANSLLGTPRFIYVDVQQVLEKYDYKGCLLKNRENTDNCEGKRLRVRGDLFGFDDNESVYLDNRPMKPLGEAGYTTGMDFIHKFSEGGLFSLDNMHLSTVGYELLAQAVQKAMPSENLAPQLVSGPAQRTGRCGSVPGDCLQLLLTPGWSLADINRREFNFLRVAGRGNESELELFRFLAGLVK